MGPSYPPWVVCVCVEFFTVYCGLFHLSTQQLKKKQLYNRKKKYFLSDIITFISIL